MKDGDGAEMGESSGCVCGNSLERGKKIEVKKRLKERASRSANDPRNFNFRETKRPAKFVFQSFK